MRAVIQRVATASVEIDGERVAAIGQGLLVLLGLDREDDTGSARRMLEKLLAYRVFSDGAGRMNRSVVDVAGGVLLVSQFTLSADTRKAGVFGADMQVSLVNDGPVTFLLES